MNKKRNGFATLECIVSLSIIMMSGYIISTSLENSYRNINLNKNQFEMLNIAKENIELIKYNIKNNKLDDYEVNNTEYKGNYILNTSVEKDKYYDQCYEVSVEVGNEDKNVKLKSYVFK